MSGRSGRFGKGLLTVLVILLVFGSDTTERRRTDLAGRPAESATQEHEVKPIRPALLAGKPTPREVDGGPNYYGMYEASLPNRADFFPVGVWMESVVDAGNVRKDVANQFNTYVDLTSDSDVSQLDGTNMHYLTSGDVVGRSGGVLPDETDMWAGPGDGKWTGQWPGEGEICSPAAERCGYSVQALYSHLLKSRGDLRYANYGKGVTFWESAAEVSKFVNDFQDVVSADNYWFSDPNICAASEGGILVGGGRALTDNECRLARNYGWTVDRVRSFVEPSGSKPVWALVEVGHPSAQADAPTISPAQIKAAVWSSLIHGARGIVYFNHSLEARVSRSMCSGTVERHYRVESAHSILSLGKWHQFSTHHS